MGIYLHSDFIKPEAVPNPEDFIIRAKPQIENPRGRFLTDTVKWMEICGFFKAKGGERYLTIGNFYDEPNTPFVQVVPHPIVKRAYYFIDDVSVEKVPYHLSPFRFADNSLICRADSVTNYLLPPGMDNIRWSNGDTTRYTGFKGPGQYWVQAMEGECLFNDTFQVKYAPPPKFSFVADTARVCVTALPITVRTDDCCARFQWSTGDTTQTAIVKQAGWLWLRAENECGKMQDSVFIKTEPVPLLNLGRDTALCDTTKFLRTLSGPPAMASYRWSTGEQGRTINITQPGIYTIEATNACGTYSDTLRVQYLRAVRLRLSPDTVFCLQTPLPLWADPEFDAYRWDTGETTRQITVGGYGSYAVTATNACGEQRGVVRVIQADPPSVTLTALLTIRLGDSVQLEPQVSHDKSVAYAWQGRGLACAICESPYARPAQSGVYTLRVSDALGCTDEASMVIKVLNDNRIYIPNIFSPNDDGQNDRLTLHFGPEVVEVVTAAVYDRWGEQMALREGLPVSGAFDLWDGTFRGRSAPNGVYVAMLRVRLWSGDLVEVVRDVALVR